jgi:hypothetical protein
VVSAPWSVRYFRFIGRNLPGLDWPSVPVKEVGGALQFGAAQQIGSNWSSPQVFYDVAPDGKKMLLDRVAQQVSQSVTVVTNFTAELEK